mgnify:CR=1 FL=1
MLAANDKRAKLELLLAALVAGEKTIVFCQKKRSATWRVPTCLRMSEKGMLIGAPGRAIAR